MKHRLSSPKIMLAALLAVALGLTLGFASTPGAPPKAAPKATNTAPAVAEACPGGGVTIKSLERVDIGTLSESFLVKWESTSPCVTGFVVKVEATRQDNDVRRDEQSFGPNARSGVLKVFGARRDNLSKSARVSVIANSLLAGRDSATIGQTTVANP